MKRIFFSSFLLLFCISQYSHACTTFFFLMIGLQCLAEIMTGLLQMACLLMVNKRDVRKMSVVQPPNKPATWKSRFGSVTFNQYGREFPTGGINEAGLVVELMWLDGTKYPAEDSRPAVGGLEWIQYHLDVSANVEELLKNAQSMRIASSAPLHFGSQIDPATPPRSSIWKGSWLYIKNNLYPFPFLRTAGIRIPSNM